MELMVIGVASKTAPWWRVLNVHRPTQQVLVEEMHYVCGEERRVEKLLSFTDVFAVREFYEHITRGKKSSNEMRMLTKQLHQLRLLLGHPEPHDRCSLGWVLPGPGDIYMCWHCDPELSKERLRVLKQRAHQHRFSQLQPQ